MSDEAQKAYVGRRRRPRYPRGWYFHAFLEKHSCLVSIYAWQYRTRAKRLHRHGRHGPHFMGRRCSWCGKG